MTRRLLILVVSLLVIVGATSGMVRLLPGDPVAQLAEESGSSLSIDEIRQELGLDKNIIESTVATFVSSMRGDFGRSLVTREPIAPELFRAVRSSIELGMLSFVLMVSLSLLLGSLAASNPSSFWDRLCTFHGIASVSTPLLWVAPGALYLFSVQLELFGVLDHLLVPAGVLAWATSGNGARLVRSRVAEGLSHPSVQAARGRGLTESAILVRYALFPVSGSIASQFLTQLGQLLAGTFVIEAAFNREGLGSFLTTAILRRDYTSIEAGVWITSLLCLLGPTIGDGVRRWIDPRVSSLT